MQVVTVGKDGRKCLVTLPSMGRARECSIVPGLFLFLVLTFLVLITSLILPRFKEAG